MFDTVEKSDSSNDKHVRVTDADLRAARLPDRPEGYFPVTREEKAVNRAINRKVDIFILPFLSLMYLFSGLDRGA